MNNVIKIKFADVPSMKLPVLENVNISRLNYPIIGFCKPCTATEVILRNGVLLLADGSKIVNIDFKGLLRKTVERSSVMGATLHMLVTNSKLSADDMPIILTRAYDQLPGETDIQLYDFAFETNPNIRYEVRLRALQDLFKKELVAHNVLRGEMPSRVITATPISINDQLEMRNALNMAKRLNCNSVIVMSKSSNYSFGTLDDFNNLPGGYFPVTNEFEGRISKVEPKVTKNGFVADYIVTNFDNGKQLQIPIKDEYLAAEIWKINKQVIGKKVCFKGTYVPYSDSVPGNVEFVCIKNY